jgi:hypothetical protein
MNQDAIHSPPAKPSAAAIRNFFRHYAAALEMCPEARLPIFILPDRLTLASRDTEELAERAAYWSRKKREVYGHIHLHLLPEGRNWHRGSTATAGVAIGIFMDIDAVGPRRKKPAEVLCPTVLDAISVVDTFNAKYRPLQASLLIGSGYGCYPAILFNEPLLLRTAEDRLLLESLSRRFHGALHEIAAQRGWTSAVDFADAAKVLRLPGCVNFKDPAHPKCVCILRETEARFTFSDVAELLPPMKTQTKKPNKMSLDVPQTAEACSFVLDHNANPHKEMFELTMELDPLFRRSWNHRRSDLRDRSQSGYDMSLAARAVSLGWPDQLVIDLIVCNRRLFDADLKRVDYYQRTLAKAKSSALRGGHHG